MDLRGDWSAGCDVMSKIAVMRRGGGAGVCVSADMNGPRGRAPPRPSVTSGTSLHYATEHLNNGERY